MKKYGFYFTLITGWLLLSGCPEDTPPVQNRDTTIHLAEVSTGIFSTRLEIAVADSSDSWMFELTRDDSTILISEVVNKDTIIQDQSLTNVTQYTYRAYWLIDSERADSSETVTILTGDTTSHNFIWTIDTLGGYGSYLNDVAIVNENNIWVVGNIETDTATYNAAHWNGEEWEMIRIINSATLYSIKYFSENDIWVTKYSYPVHWNGNVWTQYNLTEMGITGSPGQAIWGTSSSNMYFVGRNGSIVHYNGSVFTKMESGTDVDLNSISGTGSENIWVSGLDSNTDGIQEILLQYNGYSWRKIVDQVVTSYIIPGKISGGIVGVYADSPDSAWVYTHLGLYRCSPNLNGKGNLIWDTTSDSTAAKTFGGIHRNDIFVAGTYSVIWHYNGQSFHRYIEIPEIGTITGMDAQINVAVFVGSIYSTYKSFIIRGYR